MTPLRKLLWTMASLILLAPLALGCTGADAGEQAKYAVPGSVTMVDLGAGHCIPCRMMEPILERLAEKYHGKAAIVFIDVRQNPAAVQDFNLRVIPTQVFFDAQGRIVLRHEGFLDQKSIENQLADMGVNG